MVNRERYIKFIKDKLALLVFRVHYDNLLNLTDRSVCCENFFANLLNCIFNYNLSNNNVQSSNADTIDLIDDDNKICFQVTSNETTEKIRDTLNNFKDKNYQAKYNKLFILVISNKKYKANFEQTSYFLQDENIYTIPVLLKIINAIVDFDKLVKIYNIIENELTVIEPQGYVVLNEVETISEIIKYISGKENYNPTDSIEPDPDKKINTRFKSYAKRIAKEIVEYAKIYKSLFEEIYSTLSKADITKISIYLMRESVKNLELVNDPMQAIENMVDKLKKEFAIKNINIDEGALYYFLYKQVIICNVFPNEE